MKRNLIAAAFPLSSPSPLSGHTAASRWLVSEDLATAWPDAGVGGGIGVHGAAGSGNLRHNGPGSPCPT
jgi:hypothetical protein